MPFSQLQITLTRQPGKGWPKQAQTVGDHLKRKRLELKLSQNEMALKLGVSQVTLNHWEHNRISPKIEYGASIIKVLGFNPFSMEANTLGKQITNYRLIHGLDMASFAELVGPTISKQTVGRWELDKMVPKKETLRRITELLTNPRGDF